jgi:3-hydroxyisobutyrate dehydrogenase-like beta-hydroxyacid dehydrogenase
MAGTVGFIELGNMGGPITLNLIKAGFEQILVGKRIIRHRIDTTGFPVK